MADAYDVDDTGGWDATHEAAAAAAAAHAAGECFHVLVIFLDTCVPAPQGIMCRYDIGYDGVIGIEFHPPTRRDGICMM